MSVARNGGRSGPKRLQHLNSMSLNRCAGCQSSFRLFFLCFSRMQPDRVFSGAHKNRWPGHADCLPVSGHRQGREMMPATERRSSFAGYCCPAAEGASTMSLICRILFVLWNFPLRSSFAPLILCGYTFSETCCGFSVGIITRSARRL